MRSSLVIAYFFLSWYQAEFWIFTLPGWSSKPNQKSPFLKFLFFLPSSQGGGVEGGRGEKAGVGEWSETQKFLLMLLLDIFSTIADWIGWLIVGILKIIWWVLQALWALLKFLLYWLWQYYCWVWSTVFLGAWEWVKFDGLLGSILSIFCMLLALALSLVLTYIPFSWISLLGSSRGSYSGGGGSFNSGGGYSPPSPPSTPQNQESIFDFWRRNQ